jgi:hypothetical protein
MTSHSVFINCPFDAAYQTSHDAIVLTVVSCGLQPRSALETGTTSRPRMRRIFEALAESSFSVHDLSRPYGNPMHCNLARFNMPFEFGMAYLLTEISGLLGREHDWLGLVLETHRPAEYLSDLGGHDLETHQGTPESLIPPLLSWLSTRPGVPAIPPSLDPAAIISLLPELVALMAAERARWGGRLPWDRQVVVARDLIATQLI